MQRIARASLNYTRFRHERSSQVTQANGWQRPRQRPRSGPARQAERAAEWEELRWLPEGRRPSPQSGGGTEEPLCCLLSELAAAILPWVERHDREARLTYGSGIGESRRRSSAGEDVELSKMPSVLSARTILCIHSGYGDSVVSRALRGKPGQVCGLSKADELLRAAGLPGALCEASEEPAPGRVRVFRGPWLSEEKFLAAMAERGCRGVLLEDYPLPPSEKSDAEAAA